MKKDALKPPYQASRFLKVRLLLSPKSMQALIEHLEPLYFIQAAGLTKTNDPTVSKEAFLNAYDAFVKRLEKEAKRGDREEKLEEKAGLDEKSSTSLFTLTLSKNCDIAKVHEVKEGSFLTRLSEPGIQIRPCLVDFSSLSKQFSYRALGQSSLFWGLEFSYPQLVQKQSGTVENGLKEPFINGPLFKKLQKWARLNSRPAFFMFEDQKVPSELRLGQDMVWVKDMPALKQRGLSLCQSP